MQAFMIYKVTYLLNMYYIYESNKLFLMNIRDFLIVLNI